jgi:hypothetical protein
MTEGTGNLKPILETIAGVLAPITVITGLLYYFGWVRTAAIFSHFGVDQRILAYSVDDYLLRSAGVAFRPLAFVLIGVATLAAVWYGLEYVANRPSRVRPAALLLFTVATGLLGYGISVLFGLLQVRKPLWAAIALALGVMTAELAFSFLARLDVSPSTGTALALGTRPTNRAAVARRRLLTGASLVLALFWSTAIYAQLSGERLAAAWARDPRVRPSATILSEKDLKLDGRGIVVTRLSSVGEGFEYRYEGFRLLIYSNSRWFLYPDNWNSDPLATVIVLRDEPSVRVEVRVDR